MTWLQELTLIIALLGDGTYKERKKAEHDLRIHDVCFECLYKHYEKVDVKKEPERYVRLKRVLKEKYWKEYEDDFGIHTQRKWDSIMKYGL